MKKVWITGAGSAMPVVSITMPSCKVGGPQQAASKRRAVAAGTGGGFSQRYGSEWRLVSCSRLWYTGCGTDQCFLAQEKLVQDAHEVTAHLHSTKRDVTAG